MNNLVEFFNNMSTIGVKPSQAFISALDPNKKYCAYAWLEATAAPPGTPGLLTQQTNQWGTRIYSINKLSYQTPYLALF
jgi:hypothetical protein